MKYLLDTNVVSEMYKIQCNQNVLDFINKIGLDNTYISAFTFGEFSYGIERLPASRKKHDLSYWLYVKLPELFKGRVISMDCESFIIWGKMRAASGRTLPYDDSLLAASAISHNMMLVTRNIKHFEGIEGINLYNPWE